jgi:dsRNA-specific ribonuclease
VIDKKTLEIILREHGNTFPVNDINLYRKALTHRSYCTRKNENVIQGNQARPANCIPLQEESNERLEFLGDAVLSLVVGAYLYERYPDANEGFLTNMRTKLVNGSMLSDLFRRTELPSFIIISKQIEDNTGRENKKILEDCFEAFIGAMFIDGGPHGFLSAQQWLTSFLETYVDFVALVAQNKSYKDTLTKYFQHTFGHLPKFVEIQTTFGIPEKKRKGEEKDRRGNHKRGDKDGSSFSSKSNLSLLSAGGLSDDEDGFSSHSREECVSIPLDTENMPKKPTSSRSRNVQTRDNFSVCVKTRDDEIVGTGFGETRKQAENDAARKALVYFGQLNPSFTQT